MGETMSARVASQDADLNQMERVLRIEADALRLMAQTLDDSHARAVEILAGATGRIIISGVGKSGHIGRKIAATFASTGAPAMFVHATEASHGDLGMITANDVCLMISNSGETSELADLITYSRRFAIPLIAITGRKDSTLGQQADVTLQLPAAPEACIIGVAPTTSTTATLALGDALAVALMEARAFTPADFREFHPGGRLGARLATVGQLMHRGAEIPLVEAGAPMSEALLVMTQKGFGVVGVVDGAGRLVGIVTDGDLRRNMAGLLDRRAGEVMTENPRTIAPAALASEALGIMNERKITTLFAVDPAAPGKPAGVIHIHDCLRAGVA